MMFFLQRAYNATTFGMTIDIVLLHSSSFIEPVYRMPRLENILFYNYTKTNNYKRTSHMDMEPLIKCSIRIEYYHYNESNAL